MVGVAGRSKACFNCKERRKGCDLRRPTCKQCEESGYACKGYNENIYFVVYSDDENKYQSGHIRKGPFQQIKPQHNELLQLPVALSNSALTNMVLGQAWSSLAGSNRTAVHFPWIQSLVSVQTHGTAPNTALISLALARRGQENQDHSLIVKSEIMYTKALAVVSRMLHEKSTATSDDTLAAILLLALYETLQGTASRVSAWMTHIGGLYQLFRSRGTTVYDTFNSRALFRDFRLRGLIHAIGQRESSFLAHPAWKGDPWQEFLKSDKDRLLDLMCHIPSLLETADRLKVHTDIPSALSDLYALRESYAQLTGSLAYWRYAFVANQSSPMYWYEASEAVGLLDQYHLWEICPVALQFRDVETAEAQILYWTTELILHSNFYMLYHFAAQTSTADCEIAGGFPTLSLRHKTFVFPDLFDPLEKEWRIRVYVNNIVQSLEFF